MERKFENNGCDKGWRERKEMKTGKSDHERENNSIITIKILSNEIYFLGIVCVTCEDHIVKKFS